MRNQTIKVYSINGELRRHVTVREASEMISEGEAVALHRRFMPKRRNEFDAIQLREAQSLQNGTPCTLTMSDALANAKGALHPEIRKPGGYIDRVMSKVEYWPETHDDRAVVICAGRVFQPQAV